MDAGATGAGAAGAAGAEGAGAAVAGLAEAVASGADVVAAGAAGVGGCTGVAVASGAGVDTAGVGVPDADVDGAGDAVASGTGVDAGDAGVDAAGGVGGVDADCWANAAGTRIVVARPASAAVAVVNAGKIDRRPFGRREKLRSTNYYLQGRLSISYIKECPNYRTFSHKKAPDHSPALLYNVRLLHLREDATGEGLRDVVRPVTAQPEGAFWSRRSV
jgi:hypothetical protein